MCATSLLWVTTNAERMQVIHERAISGEKLRGKLGHMELIPCEPPPDRWDVSIGDPTPPEAE